MRALLVFGGLNACQSAFGITRESPMPHSISLSMPLFLGWDADVVQMCGVDDTKGYYDLFMAFYAKFPEIDSKLAFP